MKSIVLCCLGNKVVSSLGKRCNLVQRIVVFCECVCGCAGVRTAAAFHNDIMDEDQRQEVRMMIRLWNSKAQLRLTFRYMMSMGIQYAGFQSFVKVLYWQRGFQILNVLSNVDNKSQLTNT